MSTHHVFLALALTVATLAEYGCDPNGSPGKPGKEPPQAQGLPSRGENGFIETPGKPEVPVAVDAKANDELKRLSAARDEAGIRRLALSGKVLLTPARTRVQILSAGLNIYEVQLLDGPNAGMTGYVPVGWVSR